MNDILSEHYEEVKEMFGFGIEGFKRKVIAAFRKMKQEMKTANDWIFFLDRNMRDMEFKLKELETKVKMLEEMQKKKLYVY